MKPVIHVFITKSCRIRARIKELGMPHYEVTIGGMMWKQGKGRQYEDIIKQKAKRFIDLLTAHYSHNFVWGK